jgi:hypothetical protein
MLVGLVIFRKNALAREAIHSRKETKDEYSKRMIMKTTAENTGMDPTLKSEMQEACDDRIAKGILPTMEERKAAAANIDRMREENAKLFGIQDVTLDAVRASRHSP